MVIMTSTKNMTVIAMTAWVVINLMITAYKTHQWYKARFDDLPVQRKAMFPYVW